MIPGYKTWKDQFKHKISYAPARECLGHGISDLGCKFKVRWGYSNSKMKGVTHVIGIHDTGVRNFFYHV